MSTYQGWRNREARGAMAPPKFFRINIEVDLRLKLLKVYYYWPLQTFLPSAGRVILTLRGDWNRYWY